VPPTPPQSRAEGLSTVATTNEIFPGDADHGVGPSGFGIRVPMLHAHGQLNEEGRCVSDRVPERGTGRRRLSGAVGRRRRRTADLHVEPHKHVSDAWNVRTIGRSAYDLSVYGPNGFFRGFKGDISGRRGNLDVR
jgi:hypothetical protein